MKYDSSKKEYNILYICFLLYQCTHMMDIRNSHTSTCLIRIPTHPGKPGIFLMQFSSHGK
uniref:Uncharacterized protein n=1 Tax=Anguilla anguilla TaxID=7936 RepID=A0A0E9U840_ANGAN